jgi:hypothetical protein
MAGYGFAENAAFWQQVADGIPEGARVAAGAMARYIAQRAANDTLKRTSHAPGEYWEAAPGAPPASASGNLAASMYWTRGAGGSRAWAYVGNSARQAKMLEFGCHPVEPTSRKVMHWVDSGGSWYHAILPADGSDMPEHPFLRPTVEEASDDGGLRRAAIDAFRKYDP